MKKQLSMDFNTRQYMQSGDFELFYYNDTALKSVDAHEHDYYELHTTSVIKAISWNTGTVC